MFQKSLNHIINQKINSQRGYNRSYLEILRQDQTLPQSKINRNIILLTYIWICSTLLLMNVLFQLKGTFSIIYRKPLYVNPPQGFDFFPSFYFKLICL